MIKSGGIMMSDNQIIEAYKKREMTIRELSVKAGRSYESTRKLIVEAGYSNSKLRK